MDATNLRLVADAIERSIKTSLTPVTVSSKKQENDLVFDMTTLHRCGTYACIAGFAAIEALGRDLWHEVGSTISPSYLPIGKRKDIWDEARKFLDLTADEATALFAPHKQTEGIHWRDDIVPAEKAVKVLRHAADTDTINWRID